MISKTVPVRKWCKHTVHDLLLGSSMKKWMYKLSYSKPLAETG